MRQVYERTCGRIAWSPVAAQRILAVILLLLSDTLLGASHPDVAVVDTSQNLYSALGINNVTTIYLTQTLRLDNKDWRSPVNITRNITIAAHPTFQLIANYITLDLANLGARIYLAPGSQLIFRWVELVNYVVEMGPALLLLGPSPGALVTFDHVVQRRRVGFGAQQNAAEMQAWPPLHTQSNGSHDSGQQAFYLPLFCYNSSTSGFVQTCFKDVVYMLDLATQVGPYKSPFLAPGQQLGQYDITITESVQAVDELVDSECMEHESLSADACVVQLLRTMDLAPIIIKTKRSDSNLVKIVAALATLTVSVLLFLYFRRHYRTYQQRRARRMRRMKEALASGPNAHGIMFSGLEGEEPDWQIVPMPLGYVPEEGETGGELCHDSALRNLIADISNRPHPGMPAPPDLNCGSGGGDGDGDDATAGASPPCSRARTESITSAVLAASSPLATTGSTHAGLATPAAAAASAVATGNNANDIRVGAGVGGGGGTRTAATAAVAAAATAAAAASHRAVTFSVADVAERVKRSRDSDDDDEADELARNEATDAGGPEVARNPQVANVYDELEALRRGMLAGVNDTQLHILSVVGSGAYGTVYRGQWQGLEVAVKTLVFSASSENRKRALQEAALCQSINHPNIVATYTVDVQPLGAVGGSSSHGASNRFHFQHSNANGGNNPAMQQQQQLPRHPGLDATDLRNSSTLSNLLDWRLYIVQEYCDGGPLRKLVHSRHLQQSPGGPNMLVICELALELANALAHLHSKNIIHGDLNPNNVLLKRDAASAIGFRVKVADFGLSVMLPLQKTHMSNLRLGTLYYIAPETCFRGQLGYAADVFSLGVMLWELYHGRLAGTRTAAGEPRYQPDFPDFPAACPADYRKLAHRCLQKQPHNRLHSSQVVQRLQEMLATHRAAAAAAAALPPLPYGGPDVSGHNAAGAPPPPPRSEAAVVTVSMDRAETGAPATGVAARISGLGEISAEV